jgi:hypothetical protein
MEREPPLPSVASIKAWAVQVTPYGTLEVRLTLTDRQEARAWAMWLADRNPGQMAIDGQHRLEAAKIVS